MNTTDWQDIPLSYALIADPKHRIINADDVMDNSTVIVIGSYNQCDAEEARLIAKAYEAEVKRFEDAYEAHIEAMCCHY